MADQRDRNDNANSNVENNLDERDFEAARREPEAPEAAPSSDNATHHRQHARKGQAQSPAELNLNQPEKKKEGHPGH